MQCSKQITLGTNRNTIGFSQTLSFDAKSEIPMGSNQIS